MLYEKITELFISNIRLSVAILAIVILAISEILFVYFSKNDDRRSKESVYRNIIGYKGISISLSCAILGVIYCLAECVFSVIIPFYMTGLYILGIFGIVVIWIWINKAIYLKVSKEATHTHNFKKGDKIKCKSEYDRIDDEDESITLSEDYTYQFVKNRDYDLIEVKSLDKRSIWYGETKIFRDYYFKKLK